MRFGPELERRTRCAKQFQFFCVPAARLGTMRPAPHPSHCQVSLQMRALSASPPRTRAATRTAKRELLACLHIAGAKRGPGAVVFAALKSPATMSIVERGQAEWSVLALTVNPTERNLATIAAAERATLAELRALSTAAGASLRVHCDDAAQLSLQDAYAEGT